jgi:DcmR-like sensory protein
MSTDNLSPPKPIDIFWGELAACEHLVQFYEENGAFLDTLEGFVGAGLRAGDSAVVIATERHRRALEVRLNAQGIDLAEARARDQYIALDAAATLSKFMTNGWPNDELFDQVVTDILVRARQGGRRVRAFGEMVALLWERGDSGATVRLEHMWHRLCQSEAFSLFCAYPRVGFTKDASVSMDELRAAHSKVIPA